MKRRIIIIAAVLLAALMCGCGDAKETNDNSSAEKPAESSVSLASEDNSGEESKKSEESSSGEVSKPEQSSKEESAVEQVMDGYVQKEIYCDNGDGRIYGVANIVDKNKKSPLVILSHGLSANHSSLYPYAERLVKEGYSTYAFDFPGGSNSHLPNKSSTDTFGMSVITEKDALESVLAAAKNWSFVDKEQIYLLGESQGGLVTALAGCEHSDEIAGEILLYPAFNIPDEVHKAFDKLEDVPEENDINGWITVGKKYAEDVWDLDAYKLISDYKGRVIIIHGDKDDIVDVSYAEKADEVLENCEFHIINGAYHGFGGEDFESAMEFILQYLKK